MAKRFTDTNIWAEDWFLEMPNEYKLFWYFVLCNCDHSGIFKVNLRVFCSLNGVSLDAKKAVEYFNYGKERIRVISENLWLIEEFFSYQYGETFNPNNRVHDSIEKIYIKHGIKMTSIRGLKDLKDRVKDKDKDKDNEFKDSNSFQKVKGGFGGKNKNSKKGEPAVAFSEDRKFAIFEDGHRQELGYYQQRYPKPEDVKRGTFC